MIVNYNILVYWGPYGSGVVIEWCAGDGIIRGFLLHVQLYVPQHTLIAMTKCVVRHCQSNARYCCC